jgi:pectinesterase
VAEDGSGDVATLQGAIDAAPAGQTETFCHPAQARRLPWTRRCTTGEALPGPARQRRRTHDHYRRRNLGTIDETGKKLNAEQCATVLLKAADFTAEKITFENTTGPGVQALAIFGAGDRSRFRDCRFLGWQDTVRLDHGRSWFRNCLVQGNVDFIYGSGSAFFDRCEIHCVGDGCITAASTPAERPFGFVFDRCRVTAEPTVRKCCSVARGATTRALPS